ncbi:MAG: hypothetical protein WEB93_07245 [Sphingomonadales bacterium]
MAAGEVKVSAALPDHVGAYFTQAAAVPVEERKSVPDQFAAVLRTVAQNSALTDAVLARNDDRMGLTQQEIAQLGKRWDTAVQNGDRPRIESLMDAAAAKTLATFRDQHLPAGSRLFLSDNRGMLAASTTPAEGFIVTGWNDWRRIYLGPTGKVYSSTVETGTDNRFARIEVAVRPHEKADAIGVLIAEIPLPAKNKTELTALTAP